MGDKMDYAVAMDVVPEGKEGDEGFMAEHWMKAAEQKGIPTAFVIDKDTRVAWIGHPMAIDEPLAKIVAGNWDIKAEAVKAEKEKAARAKMAALNASFISAGEGLVFASGSTIGQINWFRPSALSLRTLSIRRIM
jgi:hypothetical protein